MGAIVAGANGGGGCHWLKRPAKRTETVRGARAKAILLRYYRLDFEHKRRGGRKEKKREKEETPCEKTHGAAQKWGFEAYKGGRNISVVILREDGEEEEEAGKPSSGWW